MSAPYISTDNDANMRRRMAFQQQATRPASNSVLDLLLTSQPDPILEIAVVDAPVASDHSAITFSLVSAATALHSEPRFDYRRADFMAMAENLALVNWNRIFAQYDTVEEMYSYFNSYLRFLMETFIPVSRARGARSPLPDFVRRLESRSTPIQAESRLSRDLSRAALRLRRLTEASLNIRDAREFFRYANRRLSLRSGPPSLRVDGSTVSSDVDKARLLRDYFQSVYCPPMPSPPSPARVGTASLNAASSVIPRCTGSSARLRGS